MNNFLLAGQFIYSNIEENHSPLKRRGFQTVFFTKEMLSQTDIDNIEAQIWYIADLQSPPADVFYRIEGGKLVLSHITPTSEVDKFGRTGGFIIHGLVIDEEYFNSTNIHPWTIFSHFSFISNWEDALKQGDISTGNISPIKIHTNDYDESSFLKEFENWNSEELNKIALFALQADILSSERISIAITGSNTSIRSTLAFLFTTLPSSLAVKCTFHSYFFEGRLGTNNYWAVGLPKAPDNPRFIIIDTEKRVVFNLKAYSPRNTYEQWVVNRISARGFNDLNQNRENAAVFCNWLEYGKSDQIPKNIPRNVIQSVILANHSAFLKKLFDNLIEVLPVTLAKHVYQKLIIDFNSDNLVDSLNQFEINRVLDLLYQFYRSSYFRRPTLDKEVIDLGALLNQHPHPRLSILYQYWKGSIKGLRANLEKTDHETYHEFIERAIFSFQHDITLLVVPGHEQDFLDTFLSNKMEIEDFTEFCKPFASNKAFTCLEKLIPIIDTRTTEEIQSLGDWMKKNNSNFPVSFAKAVRETLDKRRLIGFTTLQEKTEKNKWKLF